MKRVSLVRRFAFAMFGLALVSASPNARAADADSECLDLWFNERNAFQSSATKVERGFTTATEHMALKHRDALRRISDLRSSLADHSSHSLALAIAVGPERAMAYTTEILGISDALLSVRNLAEFLVVQTRYRATYAQRVALERIIHHGAK